MWEKAKIYVTMLGGVVTAWMLDLSTKEIGSNKSLAISYGVKFEALFGLDPAVANLLFILIIVFLGFVICIAQEPKSPLDAYMRGLAIFTTTGILPVDRNPPKSNVQTEKHAYYFFDNSKDKLESKAITAGFNLSFEPQQSQNSQFREVNAFLTRSPEWISSTRPRSGFWSFMLNTVNTTPVDFKIRPKTRIRIVDYFMNSSGYIYARIEQIGISERPELWIPAGRRTWDSSIVFDGDAPPLSTN